MHYGFDPCAINCYVRLMYVKIHSRVLFSKRVYVYQFYPMSRGLFECAKSGFVFIFFPRRPNPLFRNGFIEKSVKLSIQLELLLPACTIYHRFDILATTILRTTGKATRNIFSYSYMLLRERDTDVCFMFA